MVVLGKGPPDKGLLSLNSISKATQVAKANVGDLYVDMLDHPPARGPGTMVIPVEASE